MQFAKYLFKIANLHLITGEKDIPIYIMGAGERATGGGWVVLAVLGEGLAGGFGRAAASTARICTNREIFWPRGWAVSDFLLSLWHARHNRATLNRPTCPTSTAQGLHRDCTGRKDGQRINIIQYFYVRFFWLRITQ